MVLPLSFPCVLPFSLTDVCSYFVAMSKRLSLTKLAKKVEEKKSKKVDKLKGVRSAVTRTKQFV